MKEEQNNCNNPIDISNKVVGGDSNLDSLVNIRKLLIDNVVLNQQESINLEKPLEKDNLTKNVPSATPIKENN
jgi:hypothetical protein